MLPFSLTAIINTDLIFFQGNLVSIKNKKVNDFVAGLPSRQTIWIGASRSPTNRLFWSDASPWSFSFWYPRQPDEPKGKEACVFLNSSQKKWNDIPCTQKFKVVCQTGGKSYLKSF